MNLELTAADGHRLSAYRTDPAGAPRGAIVVIQEIFGVNAHIRGVVDGWAADGYVAIAPAMYDRLQRGFDVGYTPETIKAGRDLKVQVTPAWMTLDVEAAIAHVAGAGRVGIVGYCWGGFVAWMCAHHARGLSCAVDYYGSGTVENGDLAPGVPTMLHMSDRDASLPVDKVQALARQHANVEVFIYAAQHGFNCDQRATYDAASAEIARERTLRFFGHHVG